MEIELSKLFKAIAKKWWLIVLSMIAVTGGAYVYSDFIAVPVYEAYITMYVQNTNDYEGKITTDSIASAQDLIDTYIVLLNSNAVMDQVAETADLGYTVEQMNEMIKASAVNATGIMKVAVYNKNPYHAQTIANAIAEIAPDEITRVINAGNVEVIDLAALPVEQYSPHVFFNTIMGAIVGLLLSSLVILLVEITNNKIRSENDLGLITDIPVVGVVPIISYEKKKTETSSVLKRERENRRTDISGEISFIDKEAYGTARTNLMFLLSNKGYKNIVITSASPSEGKTTTCINLAITFAKAGKKVLIIDGDMRSPSIHETFITPKTPGLSDVLGGFSDLKSIVNTNIKNLSILPAGTTPPNPAELMASDVFSEKLNGLSDKYDYIFIDTPPASVFPDALSISNKASGVIIVAKYASTKKEMFMRLIDKFNRIDANLLGVVLNGFNKQKYLIQIGAQNTGRYYSKYGYTEK